MSIQILPSSVIDQIAAGEVVERPAHLVKELIENSFDAGSTEVEIDIDQGGRFIKLSDNGHGIKKEELALALERFATSKIHVTDDLWKLGTFGFRGEALASISAVSKLTLISRTAKAELASRIISNFGERSKVEDLGGTFGTTILIEDLFGNIPARLKFLKSESSEVTAIKNTLRALALAHPNVSVTVRVGGKVQLMWPRAKSRVERAQTILEVPKLYEGQAERGSVKAYAVFADPHTTAKTARQIWIFAQNRWIQDRSLQAAVNEAYRSVLMHGEYPIAAVWVETDPAEIDVNISPTKSQVKFQDPSLAFRAVQASIRDSLERAPWLEGQVSTANNSDSRPSVSYAPQVPQQSLRFEDPGFSQVQYQTKSFEFPSLEQLAAAGSREPMTQANERQRLPTEPQSTTSKWSKLQVLGQAHLTYILAQSENALVIVDQHAAHERVAYEKLMAAWHGGKIEVQDYLFPLNLDLSEEKVEALMLKTSDLEKLGIFIERLGPITVGVKAAPQLLKESVMASELDKLAQKLVDYGESFSMEKAVGDVCATLACHSVVRAGQALSTEEMRELLRAMDDFPLSCFCPHGRPVSVEYPFYRLEKDFGRTI